MTICLATDGFPPQVGGIATFNKHLVSLLTNAGHKIIVLYIDYNNNETDPVITEGHVTKVLLGKTYRLYKKKWQPYFRPGGLDAPNWIARGMAMREWVLNNHRQYNIDIIEASDYGGPGIFFCDASLPPVVITGHGSLLQLSRYNYTRKEDSFNVIRKLEELSFLNAEAVISHSPLNKADLEKLFKREIKLALIPWVNEVSISDKFILSNQLLVVGGLQPVKGIYDMMDAMVILQPKAPHIKLSWIGGDTWLAPRQQKMSSFLQKKYPATWQQNFLWKDEQTYAGTQDDIETASLVIIPAFFETFNYVAPEAAAYKKPIIITDKTGASFLFTHEVDAWIVPANNPGALAEAILYLIDNPELCRQLGENAFNTLEKVFTPQKIVAERMAIYQFAMQNRTSKKKGLHTDLSFLNNYHTSVRKYYYCTRRFIKKLIGRGNDKILQKEK